jgi:hypothetical protein
MNNFISIVVAVITFLLLFYAYWIWARGPLHPKPAAEPKKKEGKAVPTMFDVRRLLKEGDKKGATRLYAQIFKVPAKQAERDIEELERSMKI